MDRDFRKGHLKIDFPTEPFDSPAALWLRSFRIFFANLPFLAAVTLIVFLPAKLALQSLLNLLDVPSEGILSYCLMDFADLVLSALAIPAVIFGLVARLRTGKPAPLGESLRWGRRQWGKSLWNKVKVEVTVALWSLLLVIPGVVAMMKLVFTDIIVAIEGDLETEVLARSRYLSEGRRWRIFVAVLPALPLGILHLYATLRAWQFSPLAMVPVDSLFGVLDQWMTIAVLLIYLAVADPR